jgi:hypothetical protein
LQAESLQLPVTDMAIPQFPNFVDFNIEEVGDIKKHLKKLQPEVSELSVGFLCGYKDNFNFKLSVLFDSLIVFGIIEDIPSFILSPVGDKFVAMLEYCISYLKNGYGSGRVNAVSSTMIDIIFSDGIPSRIKDKIEVVENRDDADYVYKVEDLAKLRGGRYQAKRNYVKRFKEKYNYKFLELREDFIEECLLLQKEWLNIKAPDIDDVSSLSISLESRSVTNLLLNFGKIGLFGNVLLVDDKVEGFIIAEELNNDTVVVHAEKANTEYVGIYPAINQLFCESISDRYKFINWEQDVGLAGLRKSKLSYYPHHLVRKYDIFVK